MELVTNSRSMAFISQSRRTSSVASQSSSSGWLGISPCVPKSSAVRTSPTPNIDCHRRLTVTRAVSGLAGSTNQRASPSRLRGRPGDKRGNVAGVAAVTSAPGLLYAPRMRMYVAPRLRHLLHHDCGGNLLARFVDLFADRLDEVRQPEMFRDLWHCGRGGAAFAFRPARG